MTKDKSIKMLEDTLEANNRAIEALKNLVEAFTGMNSVIEDAMKSLRELDIAAEQVTLNKRVELLPCTCGGVRRRHYYVYNGKDAGRTSLICMKCGFKAPGGLTEREMRLNWNKAIEEEIANANK